MKKKYVYILSVIFTLLLTPIYAHAQIYIEGYGGVNTFTLPYGYNFTGNVGFGYNNKKVKIGVEAGLGTGIGYKYSDDPSGGVGGVSFSDYVDGESYNSTPKKVITNSGNLYPTIKNNMIFANQFNFGVNSEWFIINTFTDKSKWLDIGIFSGIGFAHHHAADSSFFQPYVKAGLELNFNVKDVTFLINGDIRYFVALKGINNQTNPYHSYIQQTVNVGLRYTIPIVSGEHEHGQKTGANNNIISVNVYNTCKQDTVTKMIPLPTTILFANDRYDIRKTEIGKLESAVEHMKDYDLHVELIGMASSVGRHNHNQVLSLQRCQSIRDYLIEHGIEEEKIKINPLGDTNSEIKEEALDRCVIMVFE